MASKRDTRTLELFSIPAPPPATDGSLDYSAELCGVLSKAIKASPHSRSMIAARMSDLAGASITVDMLNAWTAPSHERHRFPFEFAAAFESACETTALQDLLARKRGSIVLVGKEALDAELGRISRRKTELAEEERQVRARMRTVR